MKQVVILVVVIVGLLVGVSRRVDGTITDDTLHYAQVNLSYTVLVPPTTVFTLEWDRHNYASDGTFNPEYPSRLYAPVTCVYLIVGQISWNEVNKIGKSYLYIVRNDGNVPEQLAIFGSELRDMIVTSTSILNEGDYVELRVYIENEAGNQVLRINNTNPSFSITCINTLGARNDN